MFRILKKIFVLAFILCLPFAVNAQNTDAEILLLNNQKRTENTEHNHSHEKAGVIPTILKAPFNGALFFYQKLISPVLGSNCGYHVSCSRFSQRALKKKGVISGLFLTADRLTRCTPQATDQIPMQLRDQNGKIKDEKFYLD